jgi:sugar O-acyltransferase (sialic acid O-acetyltransferase NeuD family)
MNESPKQIYIVGAGGHGKVAVRAAQEAGFVVAAVFDDDPAKIGQKLCGAPIVGEVSSLATHPVRPTLVAVGDNKRRTAIAAMIEFPKFTLTHPASTVDSTARLGRGVLVLAGAVIQVDASIGDHAIVNDNATVEHDCFVGAGAHVSCNACLAGGASVGVGALIGAGAVVLPRVQVGDFATVGAGALVTTDVPNHVTVVGNPARVLRSSAADSQE